MINRYLIVREDKGDGQIYVNGLADSYDEALERIANDINFNPYKFKYEIYVKADDEINNN